MADPLTALTPCFEEALRKAFGDDHTGVDPLLRFSDRADVQADVALGLAKKLGKNPREIANAIVASLNANLTTTAICDRIEVAGPGFVNLTLSNNWIAQELSSAASDPRFGIPLATKPETVVVDYSGPNVAKEMHVGHIRSTVLGDALVRVLAFLGHNVIRQNHLGDWGTPFGMLIEHLVDLGTGKANDVSVRDLDTFYKEARAKFDGSALFADRSRERVVLLQRGDLATLDLWQRLVGASKHYFGEVYKKLDVTLGEHDFAGESMYNAMLPGMVAELQSKGLIRESEGALCAFPTGFKGKNGEPLPLIVQKKDGGFGYAATDLAALRERVCTRKATRILYVIGAPQQQHLAMVFAVAKDAGWLTPPARAEHVAFGSILGPDKKMFKTRTGGSVKLIELIDEAIGRASALVDEKNPQLDERTRDQVARQVGIGAIKYADLSSDRIKDYVFDWSRMLAFDGNTAPYLQYAHARIRSIFRKAGIEPSHMQKACISLHEPAERALGLELLGLGAAARQVADTLQPHRLCTYLYELATAFTTFYEQCPVLKAKGEATMSSRLALAALTAQSLECGLSWLGIEAPERM
ncbi:MAG: arginine--tRNA ligase [Polyangiaceae bacterium]|nr:arginine--tRNA ligase [Polyangiaceae bacterium]